MLRYTVVGTSPAKGELCLKLRCLILNISVPYAKRPVKQRHLYKLDFSVWEKMKKKKKRKKKDKKWVNCISSGSCLF